MMGPRRSSLHNPCVPWHMACKRRALVARHTAFGQLPVATAVLISISLRSGFRRLPDKHKWLGTVQLRGIMAVSKEGFEMKSWELDTFTTHGLLKSHYN